MCITFQYLYIYSDSQIFCHAAQFKNIFIFTKSDTNNIIFLPELQSLIIITATVVLLDFHLNKRHIISRVTQIFLYIGSHYLCTHRLHHSHIQQASPATPAIENAKIKMDIFLNLNGNHSDMFAVKQRPLVVKKHAGLCRLELSVVHCQSIMSARKPS